MIQGNRHLGIILYKRNLYLQLASRWMLQQVSQSVVHLLKGKHFVNTKVKKIFSLASIYIHMFCLWAALGDGHVCSRLENTNVFSMQFSMTVTCGSGRTRLSGGGELGFRRPVSSWGGKLWSLPQSREGCWHLPAASWGGHRKTRRRSWKKEHTIDQS